MMFRPVTESEGAMTFDAEQYRDAQRQGWDASAQGWKNWWEKIEQGAQVVSDRLVSVAGVAPGNRVLDVASGIGEPAVTAARAVKSGGSVVATDISPGMLDIARERAAREGLRNITFVETDESLDGVADSFDAVLSRWGVMFLPDIDGFLGRVHDLLVPGGRFAAAVWGPPERAPMLAASFGTAARVLGTPSPPPGSPGVFRFADTTPLVEALEKAGFSDARAEELTVTLSFDSADEFVRFIGDVAAPLNAMIAEQPEKKDQVWSAIKDAVRAFESDKGVGLPNVAPVVSATRP